MNDRIATRLKALAHMPRARVQLALYAAAVLSAPLAAMLSGQGDDGMSLTYQVGRAFGLAGFMIIALQVVLTGRFKVVEKSHGLDVLARFHRLMALVAVGLLFLHPILLALGGWGPRLLFGLVLPWPVWAGKAAFTILAANVFLSLFRTRLGFSFERWRFWHDILGPSTLVVGFVHSWAIRVGLEHGPLSRMWPEVFLVSAGLFAWHRFARPYLAARRPYLVSAVREEAPGVTTIELLPPDGRAPYHYLPGQFHFLTLLRDPGLPVEEHHFTISSSPTQPGMVSSTIKSRGDFTATINRTRPGDRAVVQAAFGRFSYLLHPEDQYIAFLCAGIGVTPAMSMLRHMRDTGWNMPVTLLYGSRYEDDILFREELAEMEREGRPRLKVVHVLSRPGPQWLGERGHVDRYLVERTFGHSLGVMTFYVSGPPDMAVELKRELGALGVDSRRIRWEQFALVD